MELSVLQYFLAVARVQSIVLAAKSLHLSQPTLSTQIKNWRKSSANSFSSEVARVPVGSHSPRRV